MELAPLFQTALGAGIALLANYLTTRHGERQWIRDHQWAAYSNLMKHLRRAVDLLDPDAPGLEPERSRALQAELIDLVVETLLLASKEVEHALGQLSREISDPESDEETSSIISRHTDALYEAMRMDLGSRRRRQLPAP